MAERARDEGAVSGERPSSPASHTAPDAGVSQSSKIPISTLVVVYTADLLVLLLERADFPGHWQSVTGSQEPRESLAATARRELFEETGIDAGVYGGLTDWQQSNVYEIYPRWRHRYPPGTTHNTEHVFAIELSSPVAVHVNPREHLAYRWVPWQDAATMCFSWSNRAAIEQLPGRVPAASRRASE